MLRASSPFSIDPVQPAGIGLGLPFAPAAIGQPTAFSDLLGFEATTNAGDGDPIDVGAALADAVEKDVQQPEGDNASLAVLAVVPAQWPWMPMSAPASAPNATAAPASFQSGTSSDGVREGANESRILAVAPASESSQVTIESVATGVEPSALDQDSVPGVGNGLRADLGGVAPPSVARASAPTPALPSAQERHAPRDRAKNPPILPKNVLAGGNNGAAIGAPLDIQAGTSSDTATSTPTGGSRSATAPVDATPARTAAPAAALASAATPSTVAERIRAAASTVPKAPASPELDLRSPEVDAHPQSPGSAIPAALSAGIDHLPSTNSNREAPRATALATQPLADASHVLAHTPIRAQIPQSFGPAADFVTVAEHAHPIEILQEGNARGPARSTGGAEPQPEPVALFSRRATQVPGPVLVGGAGPADAKNDSHSEAPTTTATRSPIPTDARAHAVGTDARLEAPMTVDASASDAPVNDDAAISPRVGSVHPGAAIDAAAGAASPTSARPTPPQPTPVAQTAPTTSPEPRAFSLPEAARALPHLLKVTLDSGREEARLQLWPPELGEIQVRLQVRGARVRAEFAAERTEVRAWLEREGQGLRNELMQVGLELEHLDIRASASNAQSRDVWSSSSSALAPSPMNAYATAGATTSSSSSGPNGADPSFAASFGVGAQAGQGRHGQERGQGRSPLEPEWSGAAPVVHARVSAIATLGRRSVDVHV